MVDTIARFLHKVGLKDLPLSISRLSYTKNLDNILISSEPDQILFEKFEEIYSENRNTRVYADKAYSEMVEKSDRIDEDSVNYFRYENGSATSQIVELLENSQNEKSLIISSEEYLKKCREEACSQLNSQDEFIGLYS